MTPLISLLRRRNSDFYLLRRHYVNWFAIIACYSIRDHHIRATLRNGPSFFITNKLAMYGSIRLAELIENGWTVERMETNYITVQSPSGLLFKSQIEHFGHLAEVFLSKVWEIDVRDKVVLDVGMSNADSAIYFVQRGAKQVIGLEPHPESFELAKENILLNSMTESIVPLNLALSSTSGALIARLSPQQHFVINTEKNGLKTNTRTSTVLVNGVMLEDLIDQLNLQSDIDVMKMDCEGYEFDVIPNIPGTTFARIKEIILEFHAEPSELINILKKNGFDVIVEYSKNILHAARY